MKIPLENSITVTHSSYACTVGVMSNHRRKIAPPDFAEALMNFGQQSRVAARPLTPVRVERVLPVVPPESTEEGKKEKLLDVKTITSLLEGVDSSKDHTLQEVKEWLATAPKLLREEDIAELKEILTDPISCEPFGNHPILMNDTRTYNEETLNLLRRRSNLSPYNNELVLVAKKDPHTVIVALRKLVFE